MGRVVPFTHPDILAQDEREATSRTFTRGMTTQRMLLTRKAILYSALALCVMVLMTAFLWAYAKKELRDSYRTEILALQLRADSLSPRNAVVLFGDSHVQGLCTACLPPPALNFGIGGETSTELLARIGIYRGTRSARAIVLLTGTNDLLRNEDDGLATRLTQLIDGLTTSAPLIAVAVLPVDPRVSSRLETLPRRIQQVNAAYSRACAANPRCSWMDLTELEDSEGNLRSTLHIGDGIHLAQEGQSLLIQRLTLSPGIR